MITVLPATIPRSKEQLEQEIALVAQFAHTVQVDITEGDFTPFKTWPYNGRDIEYFEHLQSEEIGWPHWEDVDIELHLMIRRPEDEIEKWIHTGVTSVVAHIEATENFQKIIDTCRKHEVSVGIALKPSTDNERIAPFVPQVDFIQCMGSDLLGKHGVSLDPRAVDKIRTLREMYPHRIIGIDIGVTEETAHELVDAGATKLICGSSILEARNPEEIFRYFESL